MPARQGCGVGGRFMSPGETSVRMVSSPDRVSHAFIRFGVLIAAVAFLVVGSDVLLDQWITGNVRPEFILGTAALIAGICVGLFAVIAAIGLAVSGVLAAVQRHFAHDKSERAT
jgi:hypothetical protein